MKIGIIGSGVVGFATGQGFLKFDHEVLFNDVNEGLLNTLSSQGFKTERDVYKVISQTDISFVCVPTPTNGLEQDLSFLKKAVIDISGAVSRQKKYHIVVLRNTILPGTTKNMVLPYFKKALGKAVNEHVGICFNPEFLRDKTACEDFLHPNRIVIGEITEKAGRTLQALYEPFKAPIIRTDTTSAEMIKYTSNVFLSVKISFFNEMYEVCKRLQIDDKVVSETVSLDPRIGKYGVYGGKPFEGKCLPKDTAAFMNFVSKLGINPDILQVTLAINDHICKESK